MADPFFSPQYLYIACSRYVCWTLNYIQYKFFRWAIGLSIIWSSNLCQVLLSPHLPRGYSLHSKTSLLTVPNAHLSKYMVPSPWSTVCYWLWRYWLSLVIQSKDKHLHQVIPHGPGPLCSCRCSKATKYTPGRNSRCRQGFMTTHFTLGHLDSGPAFCQDPPATLFIGPFLGQLRFFLTLILHTSCWGYTSDCSFSGARLDKEYYGIHPLPCRYSFNF